MNIVFVIIRRWGASNEDLTDVIAVYEDEKEAKIEAERLEREQPHQDEFWQPEDGPDRYFVESLPYHRKG